MERKNNAVLASVLFRSQERTYDEIYETENEDLMKNRKILILL